MNVEFHSAGKSTMNGVMGIPTKAENARISQSESSEKSVQFKDLLNQSKQDIKQAERQLESARENQKDLKDLEDNPKTDDHKMSADTQPQDDEVKVDGGQSTEPESKELQVDQNQVDSSLLTVDSAQLLGIQNFQGGMKEVLTNLDFKLGLGENEVPENPAVQVQSSQLVDMQGQNPGVLTTEAVPLFNGTQIDTTQNIGANVEKPVIEENPTAEMLAGPELKTKPETVPTNGGTEEVKPNQTKTIGDLMTQNVDSQNQQVASDAPNTEAVKPQKLMDPTLGLNATPALNVEVAKVSNEENIIPQTENQSLGEKGVQEINTSSINTTKGIEVQTNNNTPVVQQVEQKILQNFEPNKPMVLQMTLSPENLGDIEVQLKYDKGKLVIDIMAASRETQNLLGKQINQLVRGLALQNVQVETVHINVPVEASSTSGNTSSLMNSGSDFSQQQNNAQLRESFLRNSSIQNNLLSNGSENGDDGVISIAQNLQYNGQRRINYYV